MIKFLRQVAFWFPPVLIGCMAALLAYMAHHAFSFFTRMAEIYPWWPFMSLPVGGVIVCLFIRRTVGEKAEGSGIQQAIAAIRVTDSQEKIKNFIGLRIAAAKFIAILGTIGSGFVAGLEGPTVQIGASIFYSFRRFLSVDRLLERRQLIMAGGAAGIAAAFNAPMAGIVFAFEEMFPMFRGNTPIKLMAAVVLAGLVAGPAFGYESYFGHIPFATGLPWRLLPCLIILALCGGFVGGALSWLMVRTGAWLPFPVWRRNHPYLFIAVCGTLIALCGIAAPIFGSGAELTKEVLSGAVNLPWYYMPLKFIGLVLTYMTGLPGGIFSPSLSVGAGVGAYFLPFVDATWHNEMIAAGMVAVLAGVTRAPLTAAFIMIEMTGGQSMALQALISAFLAAWVAGFFKVHFYRDLAKRMLDALDGKK